MGEVENQFLLLIVGIVIYLECKTPNLFQLLKICALVSKNNCVVTVSRVARVVFPLKK